MEHLSSIMEQQNQDQQVGWRRDKVQELCSKGYSQREIEIPQVLQVGLLPLIAVNIVMLNTGLECQRSRAIYHLL